MILSYINWNADPEIINVWGISIRYYGLLFASGLILCIYLLSWFIIEFVKDNQVGFEDGMTLNMGQLLSLPYIGVGIGFIIYGLMKTRKLLNTDIQ